MTNDVMRTIRIPVTNFQHNRTFHVPAAQALHADKHRAPPWVCAVHHDLCHVITGSLSTKRTGGIKLCKLIACALASLVDRCRLVPHVVSHTMQLLVARAGVAGAP